MLPDGALLHHWSANESDPNRKMMIAREDISAEVKKRGLTKADAYASITRSVDIGMTEKQVRTAWGYPRDINRTRSIYGESEQWCYGGETRYSRLKYVYFQGGRVTSIQD